jgi:hypothetical protein
VLGWDRAAGPEATGAEVPCYTITLPETPPPGLSWTGQTLLCFGLADTGERGGQATDRDDRGQDLAPVDLTIELIASNGCVARLPLSHVRPLQPALHVTFTKWPYWERSRCKSPIEPVLQTFEIPLAKFVPGNTPFDLGQLQQIRFCFDRTQAAVILLDDVGLARLHHTGPGNS